MIDDTPHDIGLHAAGCPYVVTGGQSHCECGYNHGLGRRPMTDDTLSAAQVQDANELFVALGLTPDATLASVQRRLHVDSPTGMRLLALRYYVLSIQAQVAQQAEAIARLTKEQAEAQRELAGIDSVLARRPAMDQPTRRENIEKALAFAARTDEAERRNEVSTETLRAVRADYERWHQIAQGLGVKCFEADRQLTEARAALAQVQQERDEALARGRQQGIDLFAFSPKAQAAIRRLLDPPEPSAELQTAINRLAPAGTPEQE